LLNDDFHYVVELMQIHLYHDLFYLFFPNSYHVMDEKYLEHVFVLMIIMNIYISKIYRLTST
jgi:hypothetical protein